MKDKKKNKKKYKHKKFSQGFALRDAPTPDLRVEETGLHTVFQSASEYHLWADKHHWILVVYLYQNTCEEARRNDGKGG